jgi:CheY-like chemotaxis protein
VQKALKVVHTAASDGAQVVRRLVEFSRQQPSQPLVPCDLARLVDEALEITRPRWQDEAQGQGRLIEVRKTMGSLPHVLGNAAEIREALTNLLLNAVDAMPTGGRLMVTGHVEGADADGVSPSWAILTVSDTGTGMTEETRRRIFDPFFTTKGFQGTGLGLAVVYGIMERHGGRIDVASIPGEGSTFTLRFKTAASGSEEIPAATPSPASAGCRILLIDDEAPVRTTIAGLLRTAGYTVVDAESGDQGLDCLAGNPVDLVITDLGMPGMTGWEVAERIKATQPSLPIILLTGWGHQIPEGGGERNAVDVVLAKPVRLADLQDAMARAVRRRAE